MTLTIKIRKCRQETGTVVNKSKKNSAFPSCVKLGAENRSLNPDRHKNYTDPQHFLKGGFFGFFLFMYGHPHSARSHPQHHHCLIYSVKNRYLSDGTEVDLIDVEDNTIVGGKKVSSSIKLII
jgi:hypothetical protein